MKKIEEELEIILISKYTEIILNILETHKKLSVNKTLVFSYLIKKNNFYNSNIYNVRNTKNTVLKCISQLSGLYNDYCENLKYIISAIHLLIINNKISLNSGNLIYLGITESSENKKSFINLAIKESQNYSDRQFLKEVVKNV